MNVSCDKWNNAFDILKDKFRRKRLNDPFENYLHDTYFPLRKKTRKQKMNPDTAKKGAATAVNQFVVMHSLSSPGCDHKLLQ